MGIIWAENLILEIQIWQEELSAYIKDQNRPEYIWLYIFNRIMWPHMTRNTWSTIIWSTLMSVVRLETINVEWNSSLVYVPFLNSILVWTIIKVTLRRGTMPRGPRYNDPSRSRFLSRLFIVCYYKVSRCDFYLSSLYIQEFLKMSSFSSLKYLNPSKH